MQTVELEQVGHSAFENKQIQHEEESEWMVVVEFFCILCRTSLSWFTSVCTGVISFSVCV